MRVLSVQRIPAVILSFFNVLAGGFLLANASLRRGPIFAPLAVWAPLFAAVCLLAALALWWEKTRDSMAWGSALMAVLLGAVLAPIYRLPLVLQLVIQALLGIAAIVLIAQALRR